MASHRKPRPTSRTGRTAATVALTGAATGSALTGTGHAAPRPGPEQVRATVDRLQREAEKATQDYDAAKERAAKASDALERLQDEAARRADALNESRDALGSFAAAQYRQGGTAGVSPSLRLLLSSHPDDYLSRAAALERAGSRRTTTFRVLTERMRGVDQIRAEAAETTDELAEARSEAHRHKKQIERKLAEARRLLDELTPDQRARVLADGTGPHTPAARAASRSAADGRGTPETVPQADGRAAQAVAFARAQLGKPYAWGATGPSSYDCSGLTQAAWRSAGVSLPRTTYAQIGAGRRVPRGALAPGDLVVFYPGVTHVGLYIGGGKMIHAPHPGAPVRVAPVDEMPFAGAVRPA
jgi:cell wall-associated NlpC family hydrolase